MSFRDFVVLCTALFLPAGKLISQKYNFENYSVNQGLANNVVKAIGQDELGFMYFGTNNGLSVYDGSEISRLSLPGTGDGQMVFRMRQQASGKLWINFAGNRELLWVSRGTLQPPGFRNRYDINNLYEESGHRYLCTDWGIFDLKSDLALPVPLGLRNNDRVVHLLYPTGTGQILVGRKGYSLGLLEQNGLKLLDETPGDYSVTDILRGPDGDFWMATDSHGLMMLDGKAIATGKLRFKTLPPALQFLGREDIFCLRFNPDDQSVLVGTSHYGVLIYRADGSLDRLNRDNGLSGNKVNCIYIDRNKTWWIGTDFGVDKLTNTNLIFYNTGEGKPIGSTFKLEKDSSGRTWFFGNEYCFYTEGEHAVQMDYPPNVEKIALGSAATAGGIWVGIPNHVFFIDTRPAVPIMHKPIRTVDTYRRMVNWNNKIILGGKHSLAMLDQNNIRILSDSFVDIRAICKDRFDKLWIGTFSHGIFRISLEQENGILVPRIMQQILDSNSNYNRFLSLSCDKQGRIWAGTRFHGVYVYEVGPELAAKKYEFNTSHGLSNNYITSISQYGNGDVWIGTSTGFDRITENKHGISVVPSGRFYRFNNSVNQLITDERYLWAATDVGAIRIRLSKEKKYRFPTYFKQAVFPDSVRQIFSTDTSFHLSARENSFSVNFTAPFYINEHETQYFYRLIYNTPGEWTEARATHSINFNSLASGRYVLELRSIPFTGQSDQVSRLRFIIATPFYKTTWFIVLLLLSAFFLGYLLYRYRIRELKKLYMVRDNISRNLHDEIGATLSSINIYSDVARSKVNEEHEIKPLLDRIYTGSGQVMENMNDIVWYVNPKNDSWEDILVRMREFAIPILEARNMDVSFDVDGSLLPQKLSMQQRQNIYYIFKEAVNNTAKYSNAGAVHIQLQKTASGLKLSITDDGTGFSGDTVKRGNGLSNMEQRAAALKGSLQILADPGKGTAIHLELEL